MISVIIPTYNERENIEKLIPQIFGQFMGNFAVIQVTVIFLGFAAP